MTTSPPQVNGHRRPLPVFTDWRTFAVPSAAEPVVEPAPEPQPEPATPSVDLVAQAEADAIRARAHADAEEQRARAAAEAEALRIKAEGEAKAAEIKAAEEARKLKLANDKAEARAIEEQAARDARIAKSNRERQAEERAAREAEERAATEEMAETKTVAEVAAAEEQWRKYALSFYAVCSIVALPVQIAAFYNPDAIWLMAAPIMLEGGAWVVLKGARAAAASHRPHWHYRLIAWALAFIAAGINLWHGLHAFDPATAIGTAFASIAGPGVYDLHEHGKIRKRDGVPTRRERRATKKAAKRAAEEQAAAELFKAERLAHLENAARDAASKLDADRKQMFPRVHAHALKLAADLGETAITPAIWKQAKLDVDGAGPGESDEILRMRNRAAAKVEAARLNKPVSTPGDKASSQRASQIPGAKKPRVYNPPARPGRRRPGDTPKYVEAARKQASIAAKNASTEEQK